MEDNHVFFPTRKEMAAAICYGRNCKGCPINGSCTDEKLKRIDKKTIVGHFLKTVEKRPSSFEYIFKKSENYERRI